MRKFVLALAAAAAFGLAVPIVTTDVAQATTVRRHHDRGLHRGFSHSHHYGYGHRHHHMNRHHHHHHRY